MHHCIAAREAAITGPFVREGIDVAVEFKARVEQQIVGHLRTFCGVERNFIYFAIILESVRIIIHTSIDNIEMLYQQVQTSRSVDHICWRDEGQSRNVNGPDQHSCSRYFDQMSVSTNDIEVAGV